MLWQDRPNYRNEEAPQRNRTRWNGSVSGFFAVKTDGAECWIAENSTGTPVNRGFAEVSLVFLTAFSDESSFVGGAANRYRCPPESRCLAGANAQLITPRYSDEPALFAQ
ncbi:hypothetical protein [Trichococcus ilyis]|jgi:hypothetical protein|uniref:hypothetical protein n=1 Tax=Trichococcus ilyis TaxID=640938 RepID=UPI0010421AFE|nr:hypothetical protein [Trichococcus ilyis]